MPEPLWPKPIPIIGLTGEYASGKTLFGLTIAPGPETLVYDMEKSSESYLDLGFARVDAHEEMLKAHKSGYKPRDLWAWWKADILKVPPGKYRVIMLDPVSEIEAALTDHVQSHPAEFGRTASQYAKSSGLMWGDMKQAWKQVLSDLASRCETFVFTAHMGAVYAGNAPTGRRKPKGKETLEELASLYLQLERRPGPKGETPAAPSAVVRKQRLLHTRVVDGAVSIVPALPPRLPVATPDAIRQYQRTPPDYARLRPDELAPEGQVSDEEMAELRARTAEAEAEAERIKLERMDRLERSRARPLGEAAATPTPPAPPAPPAPPEPKPEPKRPAEDRSNGGLANAQQLEALASLRQQLFDLAKPADPKAEWSKLLARRGVTTAKDLSFAQAEEFARKLEARVAELKLSEIPF